VGLEGVGSVGGTRVGVSLVFLINGVSFVDSKLPGRILSHTKSIHKKNISFV
jgi:hypothetical protein